MDHLSKFYLNRTINEPRNVVLQKLRKLENWRRLAPKNQEPRAWQYKTSTWRFLLHEMYEKQRFFMKRTPTRIAWRQLFTIRRFLIETQKLGCFNMSCLAALKARQTVSRKFPETYHSPENHTYNTFMLVIQFIIMNLKSRNAMNSSPNLGSLLKRQC